MTTPAATYTETVPDSVRRRVGSTLLGLPLLCSAALSQAADAPPSTSRPRLPPLDGELVVADVPLLDGATFHAADASGKVLVLYWWASWCPFCAIQTPMMQALWDAQRKRGLLMLGISIDERPDDARRYLSKRGYTFPSTFQSPIVRRLLPLPGKGLPVTVVRGRNRRVVMAEAGQVFAEDIARIDRFL